METSSASLALWEGNPAVTVGYPSQRPVRQSFDVFLDLRLNKWLNKRSQRWRCPAANLGTSATGQMVVAVDPPHRNRLHVFNKGFVWHWQRTYKIQCASPSNATPGVRPLGRTPRISSMTTAFPWRQWPDQSAASKHGLAQYQTGHRLISYR